MKFNSFVRTPLQCSTTSQGRLLCIILGSESGGKLQKWRFLPYSLILLLRKSAWSPVFLVFCYYDPFKVVFRVNCLRKSCSPWCVVYFEKFLSCDVTLSYDVLFGQKRRLFCNFLQKWVVYTLLKSFFRQNS